MHNQRRGFPRHITKKMEQKYFVRKVIEYSCVVFQVVNKKTNCVAYYDKDEEIAKRVCDKWNNTKT